VFDAFGKPPSGILEGNTLWNGQYSECLGVIDYATNLKGKYFRIGQPMPYYPGLPSVKNILKIYIFISFEN